MQLDDARRFALSLPEVTEEPHFEKSSFRIRNKIFATVPLGDEYLNVLVDEEQAHAAVAEDPAAFSELWWGKKLSGVRVLLATAPQETVFELLEDAWRRRAPRPLVRALDERGSPGET